MSGPAKRVPRFLTVKKAKYLTPNMIRVTFSGPELEGFPTGKEGANCKLVLPREGETREDFINQLLTNGAAKNVHPVRTYTVRSYRAETGEMDIDFVAHGDEGPATRWAQAAKQGSFLGFFGPGPVKVETFHADWYLVAADMSALPVAAATLEAMPEDAKGIAIFEVHSEADRQEFRIPPGIDVHWMTIDDPHKPSPRQEAFIRDLDWPEGTIQTCIAGEGTVIAGLRSYLLKERKLPRKDAYVSGYWKLGLIEDEHQQMKREEAAAEA